MTICDWCKLALEKTSRGYPAGYNVVDLDLLTARVICPKCLSKCEKNENEETKN